MEKTSDYCLRNSLGYRNIDENFANQLLQSQKNISRFLRILTYKYIVKRNLEDLISYLQSFTNKSIHVEVDSAECNRLLYNFLNTLYAFEQSFNKDFRTEISAIKQEMYKNFFDYSIVSALRDYMEHKDLGVSKIVKTYGKFGLTVKVLINLETIAKDVRDTKKYNGFVKTVKAMIDAGKDIEVDILPLSQNFDYIFFELQAQIWKTLSNQIIKDFKLMSTIFNTTDERNFEVFLYKGKQYLCPISNTYKNFI